MHGAAGPKRILPDGGHERFGGRYLRIDLFGAYRQGHIWHDTDHEKTGGAYIRIGQRGGQCTVGASGARNARIRHTWRIGND